MRRTIVLIVAMAAMVMVYAGAALAEDTLDAHYSLDGTEPSYSGFNQRYKQAQTFTVENTGDLTRAEVTVNRSSSTTSDLKMDIVSVNASGLPTDNVLASATLPASEIVTYGGGALETFAFDEPAVVRAGKQYAFVMDGNTTTTYDFGLALDSYSGSPGYPGGQGYWLNHDFTVLGGLPDHLFAIYVAPRDVPDVTGPVLSLPDDITEEAEGPDGATVSWSAPTATDDVDDSVTVNCDADSGDTFPLGTTTVTCSATDAAGNKASDSFAVTVRDATPPTLSVSHTPDGTNGWNKTSPVSLTVSSSDTGSGVAATPTCTDGSAALTLTAGPAAGNWTASVSGEGTHDVSCSVSDNANNSTNASNTIKIDETAPEVSAATPTGTGVGRGTNVVATFSEAMSPASITKTTFKLFKVTSTGTTQVTSVTVTPSSNGLKATLNPFGTSSTLLAKNTKYKAVVTTGAEDLAGNRLDQNTTLTGNQQKTWTFTTKG